MSITTALRSWLDRLRRFVIASRIINGPSYTVKRTPDGSVLLFNRARGGGGSLPDVLVCRNGEQVLLSEISPPPEE